MEQTNKTKPKPQNPTICCLYMLSREANLWIQNINRFKAKGWEKIYSTKRKIKKENCVTIQHPC